MANLKTSCLKKGVVLGRIGEALNELFVQIDIVDDPDLEISRGAVNEIKNSLRPLKKNFRTSAEEVRLIDAGVQKMGKLLRGNPNAESLAYAKVEMKEIRTHFSKIVGTGFVDCGAPKRDAYEIREILDDNAYYTTDSRPQS
jgi:hypothetical protein